MSATFVPDPLEVLTTARMLIDDPANWTQGENARNSEGEKAIPGTEAAICFCVGGAVAHVVGGFGSADLHRINRKINEAAMSLLPHNYDPEILEFIDINDGIVTVDGLTPHQAALKVLDLAIENERKARP